MRSMIEGVFCDGGRGEGEIKIQYWRYDGHTYIKRQKFGAISANADSCVLA